MKPALHPLKRALRDLFRVEPLEARVLLSADPVLGAVQVALAPEQDPAALLTQAYQAPADIKVTTTPDSTVLVADNAQQPTGAASQWLLVDTAQLADGNGRVVVGGADSNAVIHVGTAGSTLQLGDLVLMNPQNGGEIHMDGALNLSGNLFVQGSGHTSYITSDVTAAGRRNFERLYDLTERVLPPEIVAAPTPAEHDAIRALALEGARALGIGTEVDIRDYFRLPVAETRHAVAELVAEGALLPVSVDGWEKGAYLHHEAARPARTTPTALLSPFDPLVWFRPRTERLFGFHYRLELYTPPAKRKFGYYVLPFLHAGRLSARLDLKTHRAAGVLEAAASTSSLVMRPSLPVPLTVAGSTPVSSTARRTEGLSAAGASPDAGACWPAVAAGEASVLGVSAGAGAAAGAALPSPASIVAIIPPTWTVSPTCTACSPITPATGLGTSTETLSVSRLAIGSSAATASPGCFSHSPSVASVIDSPSVGTLTSVAISYLVTPAKAGVLLKRRDPSLRWGDGDILMPSCAGIPRGHCGRAHRQRARPVRAGGASSARWPATRTRCARRSARASASPWPRAGTPR